MENINFLVLKHSRLNFQGAERLVSNFITDRLKHFGANHFTFISRESLIEKIAASVTEKDYLVVLDIMNPIVDLDLVNQMVLSLNSTGAKYAIADGAIPGTQVEFILAPGVSMLPDLSDNNNTDVTVVRWFSQDMHNNQFNLYKYKRLKMFLFLIKNIKDVAVLDISSFINRLSADSIFDKLAAFGEAVKVHFYKKCPHCQGRIIPLPMKMSQAFCGYLPVSRPLYHECEKCGLIVISPYVDENETSRLYDVFDKQDFVVTLNDPYHKGAPRCGFTDFIDKLPKVPRTLDLGGGMGGFSKFLKESYSGWQVTHSDFEIKRNIDLEGMGIRTLALNFLKDPIGENCYDLITAWEVLEHIPYDKLEFALNNIYKALSKSGVFMFSTPDFDSPLCQSNDFFAICPPFHYLVFGRKWLKKYFANSKQWEIHSMRSCSDFLDDSKMWFDYANKTAPSFQLRATAKMLKELLARPENKQLLLDKDMGTEVIVTLIKKETTRSEKR